MKRPCSSLKTFLIAAVAAVALACAFLAPKPAAIAATPNVTPGAGQVVVIPFHISGAVSATTAAVVKFNMPFPCRVLGVGAVPRALTGSSNTVDVKLGGTTILSAPIAMTAGTYAEGTVTTATITDEGVITIDMTIPSGSLTDTTIMITVVRR